MSKALMAAVPVVIVAAIGGLGFAGVIKIPGLTPAAKAAAANYNKDDPTADPNLKQKATSPPVDKKAAKKEEPPAKSPSKPTGSSTIDPEHGADALATVWNGIKTPDLVLITAKWKDADLAKVLVHMDSDLVSKFLETLTAGDEPKVKPNPERASKLSKIIQEQGSVIKPPAGAGKTP